MSGPIRVEKPKSRKPGSEYVYNGEEPADLTEDEIGARNRLIEKITLLKLSVRANLPEENLQETEGSELFVDKAGFLEPQLIINITPSKLDRINEILPMISDAYYKLHQFDFNHSLTEKFEREIRPLSREREIASEKLSQLEGQQKELQHKFGDEHNKIKDKIFNSELKLKALRSYVRGKNKELEKINDNIADQTAKIAVTQKMISSSKNNNTLFQKNKAEASIQNPQAHIEELETLITKINKQVASVMDQIAIEEKKDLELREEDKLLRGLSRELDPLIHIQTLEIKEIDDKIIQKLNAFEQRKMFLDPPTTSPDDSINSSVKSDSSSKPPASLEKRSSSQQLMPSTPVGTNGPEPVSHSTSDFKEMIAKIKSSDPSRHSNKNEEASHQESTTNRPNTYRN